MCTAGSVEYIHCANPGCAGILQETEKEFVQCRNYAKFLRIESSTDSTEVKASKKTTLLRKAGHTFKPAQCAANQVTLARRIRGRRNCNECRLTRKYLKRNAREEADKEHERKQEERAVRRERRERRARERQEEAEAREQAAWVQVHSRGRVGAPRDPSPPIVVSGNTPAFITVTRTYTRGQGGFFQ